MRAAPPPPRAREGARHGRAPAAVGVPLEPRRRRAAHRRRQRRAPRSRHWTEADLRRSSSRWSRPSKAGELLAERAKDAGVETCVFDRGGYRYHGRVKALADGAREGGSLLRLASSATLV